MKKQIALALWFALGACHGRSAASQPYVRVMITWHDIPYEVENTAGSRLSK